jgi:hypothetical protein
MIAEAKVGHDLSNVEPNGGYVEHDNGGCGHDFTLFKHDIGKVEPAGGYVEHEIGGSGHDFGDFGKRPARFF